MGNHTKQNKKITFRTKEGTFIVYPPNDGRLSVKVERTAKGQLISIGYFEIATKEWHVIQGMKVPFGVQYVIEQQYA